VDRGRAQGLPRAAAAGMVGAAPLPHAGHEARRCTGQTAFVCGGERSAWRGRRSVRLGA
jgi:hypothetical protein